MDDFMFVYISMVLIVGVIIYTIIQVSKRSINCSSIALFTPTSLTGIGARDPRFNRKLYDYYVKSSYNSCATGAFTNDFVDMCALKNVVKQGFRLLDFEIYSVNQTAVVCASATVPFTIKGTYNYLVLDDVLKYISENAISMSRLTDDCPNASDPLFLHFRIKSNKLEIYDSIATSIRNYFGKYLLSSDHSYENNGHNLGLLPLINLMSKVIIIVDKTDKTLESSKLYEYTNIASKSVFMRVLPFTEVKNAPDMDELINYNKKNMTICIPDDANNYNTSISMQYGCQFCALNAQFNDSLLTAYNRIFNEYAFTVKPQNLRYVPVTVDAAKPIDPNLSFGYKTHETPYFGGSRTQIKL